jgi:hypothetical protein
MSFFPKRVLICYCGANISVLTESSKLEKWKTEHSDRSTGHSIKDLKTSIEELTPPKGDDEEEQRQFSIKWNRIWDIQPN